MDIKESSVNILTGVRTLIYLILAIIAFRYAYPLYTTIKELTGLSTSGSVTIAICFWLVAFAVVYLGTYQVFKGRTEESGDFGIYR